jgi:hypothetical protein
VLDSTHTSTDRFETATSGNFKIGFELLSEGKKTATSGTVNMPLRGDWSWHVSFHLATTDPSIMCFGCTGSSSYDLDPMLGFDPDVRLWVVWGGNSITNPVVY